MGILIDSEKNRYGSLKRSKQNKLVSGENIKTVNGESLLGSGNIIISPDGTISIDTILDENSENAIANKAVTLALRQLLSDIQNGAITAKLADNLASWAARNAQSVESSMAVVVRSTAGDESIDAAQGAMIKSIVADSDLSLGSAAFISSGFNLLRLRSNNGLAVAVGTGWYFPVPKLDCSADTINTSDANNGVLLTDANGNNIANATVYFKPLSDGVPTTVTDGTACSYVTIGGRRHYICSEAGYLIISGITYANTCAHLAWSSDYDKYVSPTDADDAGTVVSLAALGDMLVIGENGNKVSAKWERTGSNTGRKTSPVGTSSSLSWINTLNEDGINYTHAATVSDMKMNGLAEIKLSGETEFSALNVSGNIISITDSNATVAAGYVVKYVLETPSISNVNITTNLANINDWGVETLVGATGNAVITLDYAQGIPDAVFSLLSRVRNLEGEVDGLKEGVNIALNSIEDYRLKPLAAANLIEGAMLFYDRKEQAYKVCDKRYVAEVLRDMDLLPVYRMRYETNYDTYVGTIGDKAHFVACDDANPIQNIYSNNVAATACHYRLEITEGTAGEITFSVAAGGTSIAETTITWGADATMEQIVALFVAKNVTNISFAALSDGNGVGLSVGGYGANTLTVTGTPVNCNVVDCSGLAFLRSQNPAAPAVGGIFDPAAAYTYLGEGVHHNFRGVTAKTILATPYPDLVADSSTLIANNGINYSYRCGGNKAKFRSWASASGDNSFVPDGVNGSTASSSGKVMRKSAFDAAVNASAVADSNEAKMYEYYNHLLTDQSGSYQELRMSYESKYGQMTDLYDAYLMSHMVDPFAVSGIAYTIANKGKAQTEAKADCMNVTYNYVIVPAYPPEYNAANYGKESEGFAKGNYYHPEPADLGLMFRDDVMPLINANVTLAGVGTNLTDSQFRSSCADYNAITTWFFIGTYGCIYYSSRYNVNFLSRPSIALSIPS